jgi:hypothetical protein
MVNKHKKTNNNKSKSQSKSHFDFENLPWKSILIGVVIFIVLLGIVQVIHAIQSISQPLSNFFQGAAALGGEILTPCIQQVDCNAIGTDCNTCKNNTGCTCGNGKTCTKYATRDVGSGGFFQSTFPFINLNCFLGVGFIALIIGGPLLAFIKLIISAVGRGCVQLKDYVTATGKKSQDVVTDWSKKSEANTEKTKEELKKQGIEITPELSNTIGEISINDVATKEAYDAANSSTGSLQDRQTMVKNSTIKYNEAEAQYKDSMNNYDEKTKDIVENNREKPGPEPKI